MKNKWLAAALNLIPGLGYLYLGTRTAFAVMLLLVWPAAIITGIFDPVLSANFGSISLSWGTLLVLALTLGAFMLDAFMETAKVNALHVPTPDPIPQLVPKLAAASQVPPQTSTATISVPLANDFLIPRMLRLALAGLLLVIGLSPVIGTRAALTTGLLVTIAAWLFLVVLAARTRLQLTNATLTNTFSHKTIRLDHLTNATTKGHSIRLTDAQGATYSMNLQAYYSHDLARLLEGIRPYLKRPGVQADSSVLAAIDELTTPATHPAAAPRPDLPAGPQADQFTALIVAWAMIRGYVAPAAAIPPRVIQKLVSGRFSPHYLFREYGAGQFSTQLVPEDIIAFAHAYITPKPLPRWTTMSHDFADKGWLPDAMQPLTPDMLDLLDQRYHEWQHKHASASRKPHARAHTHA